MNKKNRDQVITLEKIKAFALYLQEQEKSAATISKYTHDLNALCDSLQNGKLTKTALLCWKEKVSTQYAAASVNTMLAALNSFLDFYGWTDLKVKPLKIQHQIFCSEDKELTREEYVRLVMTAKQAGNERLFCIIQTICATGIRVSELRYITVEAVHNGRVEVNNKGKQRLVFLPEKLRGLLRKYLRKKKINAGAVFVTRNGKPMDRSNIWREMKLLCKTAGVASEKVFPHNLRHLFARTYYSMEKDLSRLADILGHSSINTTRIYTMESGAVHEKQVSRMGLVIT